MVAAACSAISHSDQACAAACLTLAAMLCLRCSLVAAATACPGLGSGPATSTWASTCHLRQAMTHWPSCSRPAAAAAAELATVLLPHRQGGLLWRLLTVRTCRTAALPPGCWLLSTSRSSKRCSSWLPKCIIMLRWPGHHLGCAHPASPSSVKPTLEAAAAAMMPVRGEHTVASKTFMLVQAHLGHLFVVVHAGAALICMHVPGNVVQSPCVWLSAHAWWHCRHWAALWHMCCFKCQLRHLSSSSCV